MLSKWIIMVLLLLLLSCSTTPKLTYSKYMDFLYANDISERQWVWGEYMCANFALDTIEALREKGFPAYPMLVEFKSGIRHLAVAFKVEGKWHFVEPQGDEPFLEYWDGLQYRASVYEHCQLKDETGHIYCKWLKFSFWV